MKRKNFLDKLEVKSPCRESWDEMFGNNEVRFCSHCAKNVHYISAMTRQKAEELVKKADGNLCVRYVKNPSGNLISAPTKFTQITRRATIAASVLATSLTLTSLTYAQGKPVPMRKNVIQNDKTKTDKNDLKQGLSTITGIITDANGGVISGAKVTLEDIKTKQIWVTMTNSDGEYIFKKLEPSLYELTIESPGFNKFVMRNIEVSKNSTLEKTLVLEVGEPLMGVLVTSIGTEINEEKIESLPINGRQFTETIGMTPGVCQQEKPKTKPKKKKK